MDRDVDVDADAVTDVDANGSEDGDVRNPVAVETVLAPVDGSEASATAVEYAIAIADRYAASVHVLFVLGEGVITRMDSGAVDETTVAQTTQQFLEDVMTIAEDEGVRTTTAVVQGFSPTIKTRHPGSVVLDSAAEVDADFVVVPRASLEDQSAEVLEKAAEYVLSYASQPVLSV